MEKTWAEWVRENLDRNCDPNGIVDILLENKFGLTAIREYMGDSFPAGHFAAWQKKVQVSPVPGSPGYLSPKQAALFHVRRELSRLAPRKHIERRSNVSRAEFLEEYYAANTPVILSGLMDGWKACTRWGPEYFKTVRGDETVEIQAGRDKNPAYEEDDSQLRKTVKFSDYIDMVTTGGETNDYYLTARNNFFSRPGTKALLNDIEVFREYLKTDNPGDGTFLWYGPKGTITPLHHDLMNIFMAQVQGRKRVILIPSSESDLVYNDFAVYSPVDPVNPDYARHPKFRAATVYDVELAPGEVLFLPVGWWHHVTSLDVSMTVSFNNFVFLNEFKW